jgi:hypothetical protein
MTGQLHDALQARARELDPWEPDLDLIVSAGDRRVRRRRVGLAGAGLAVVAAVATAATLVGLGHHGSSVDSGFASGDGDPAALVHTRYYDVPAAPDGYHVVGSLPDVAVITKDGTVYDLYRDTDTGLPEAERNQVLLVQYNAYAADPFERSQDPDPGERIQYDGRTFFHNTTWYPDVDSVQYQRGDGSWLRLQYPKQEHFTTAAMVAYLDAVQVNAGATQSGSDAAPKG